ncbi:MAG: hypothetical protein ABIN89_26860 [Chitinophagaceae bacterium]
MNAQSSTSSEFRNLLRWGRSGGKIRSNLICLPITILKTSQIISFILVMIIFVHSNAQRVYDWRTNVDMLVERADSLSLKSQNTFYQNRIIKVDKTFKNDKTIRETWYYTISEGRVIIFQVRYLIDSTEYMETYYLNNGNLVCLEQYESDFYSPYDEINWGKVLFLDNNTVKLNVSVGRRKSQEESSYTSSEAIEKFNKRYTELLRNLRIKARG